MSGPDTSGPIPRTGVVLVAAGSGQRLAAGGPKALVALAGRPLLAHALDALAAAGLDPPVVVHTPGARPAFEAALAGRPVTALVPGGDTRTASVAAGLAALPAEVEVVAVHDAARALMPAEVLRACVAGLEPGVAALAPALPVADTLKRVEDGVVVGTVPRDHLVGVQTPQVFPRAVLSVVLEAALAAGEQATDDLALVEQALAAGRLEGRVVVVPGSLRGRKITFPEDLALAAAWLAADAAAAAPSQAAAAAPSESAPDVASGTGARA